MKFPLMRALLWFARAFLLLLVSYCWAGEPPAKGYGSNGGSNEGSKRTEALTYGPTQPLSIAVSIHPLALIVKEIFGDDAELREIFSAGADPHHHNLSFAEVRLAKESDIVVWLGPQLEVPLTKLLGNRPGVLTLSQRLPSLHREGSASLHDEHHHEEDMHVWLDPQKGVEAARLIIEFIDQMRPDVAGYFDQQLSSFILRTEQTQLNISKRLQTSKGLSYIAEHNAYSYFSDRFELDHRGSLHNESGVRVGPADYMQMLQGGAVGCLVAEPGYNRLRLENLAEKLGAQVVEIDPLGGGIPLGPRGYQQLLLAVAQQFEKCETL